MTDGVLDDSPLPFTQTNEVYRFYSCKAHGRRCSSYLQPYDLSIKFLDSPSPLLGIERKYGHENALQDGEFEADLPIQDTSTPGIKPVSILSSSSLSNRIILNYFTIIFTW